MVRTFLCLAKTARNWPVTRSVQAPIRYTHQMPDDDAHLSSRVRRSLRFPASSNDGFILVNGCTIRFFLRQPCHLSVEHIDHPSCQTHGIAEKETRVHFVTESGSYVARWTNHLLLALPTSRPLHQCCPVASRSSVCTTLHVCSNFLTSASASKRAFSSSSPALCRAKWVLKASAV